MGQDTSARHTGSQHSRYAIVSGMGRGLSALLLVGALAASPAIAEEDHEPMARALVTGTLYGDMHRPVVISTILEKNSQSMDESATAILAFERQWGREKLEGGGPLLASVDQNALSTYLRTLKAESGGLYTELLVMDKRGFLVGGSDIATDYFQGDERKYLMTYPLGPKEIFVDLIEYDASVQTLQSQVSFTIVDPESGEPIGAVTIGINGMML